MSKRRRSAASTGLHQPECVRLARSRLAIEASEGSGQSGKPGLDDVCLRHTQWIGLTLKRPSTTQTIPSSPMLTWRSLKITRHEDAIVVATVLHASSDSEVLDWKRSCYVIRKWLLAKTRSMYTNIFLLDPEVMKKQYPESAKREEFI